MRIDEQALFGGNMSWGRITQKAVAEEADLYESTLSKVKLGHAGFSPIAAKKAASIAGVDPANLYVLTQTRSAAKRRDEGEIDDAAALRIVGRVVAGLKEHFPDARITDEAAKALQDLATKASQSGARPTSQMDRLGRDGSGLKVQKNRERVKRDGSGLAVQKRYGN